MIRDRLIEVQKDDEDDRLDVFILKHFPEVPRSFVKKAIESSQILLNGKSALKGAKVAVGDSIIIKELPESADNRVKPDPSIVPEIVYDDGVLLGVDKPSGMSVQPLSMNETGTLMNGLVVYAPELSGVGDDPLMAGALHRIDGGTSGLVMASRTNELWSAMRDLFAARKVKKTYLALVEGHVSKSGKVSCELVHDPKMTTCRMIKADGIVGKVRPMLAETFFKPLHTAGHNTLLEVTIYTGVTHQIRAQLAIAGHPIVGDALYGAKCDQKNLTGHRLHAYAVDFLYPFKDTPCHIATDLPTWAR